MRLFVGVWLSENIQDLIMNYIESSRREVTGWKWTKRQNLHFTLKFLGEVSENRLDGLHVALKTAAANFHPFTLELGNMGFFPKRGIPRIMWLGVGYGEPELIQVAALVEENCQAHGFGKSDKPFQPHVTIARAKQEDIRTISGTFPDFTLLKLHSDKIMLVDGFSLIESSLNPGGAIYKTVADFKFESQSVKYVSD
jgi:2'-5' RNA ligase